MQANDTLTSVVLSDTATSWQEIAPTKPYNVAWLYVYPKVGVVRKVKHYDPDEPGVIERILEYQLLTQPGDVYKNTASCADAVAMILVKGVGEEMVQKNIRWAYEYFSSGTVYDLLPLDTGADATLGSLLPSRASATGLRLPGDVRHCIVSPVGSFSGDVTEEEA